MRSDRALVYCLSDRLSAGVKVRNRLRLVVNVKARQKYPPGFASSFFTGRRRRLEPHFLTFASPPFGESSGPRALGRRN